MEHIQALKHLDTAIQLAVTVGQPSSTVSCFSWFNYHDVLGEDSPMLRKLKKRIQIIQFPSLKLELIINLIQKSWKKPKTIDVLVSEKELIRNSFLNCNHINIISDNNNRHLVIKAYNFFLVNIRDEAYTITDDTYRTMKYLSPNYNFYPHIYVVFDNKPEFIKVNSPEEYEFLGKSEEITLGKETMHSKSLSYVIELAKSFFLQNLNVDENKQSVTNDLFSQEKSDEKFACELIKKFCDDIGQLSISYARLYNISKVIIDCSISNDILIKKNLTESINRHSDDSIKAIFLRHENFIHGIRGLVCLSSAEILQKHWNENYGQSSALAENMCLFQGVNTLQLTLDSLDNLVTVSSLLLSPEEYFSDRELSKNPADRDYWLSYVGESVSLGVERLCINATEEAAKNLKIYKNLVLERFAYLKLNHQAYGEISMRVLQEILEGLKKDLGLINIFEKRKRIECETALRELGDRLKYLDTLSYNELHTEIIKSFLAGNIFDWGPKEVAKLMNSGKFNFDQALNKIPERPWLIDDLQEWIKTFKVHSYQSVMVFVDNCGYDLILGVLPFVRELIRREAKVVICANCEPVLNDVTYYELEDILEKVKDICPIIKEALEQRSLTIMSVSKSSCSLDLSFIDVEIAKAMDKIDLLVIDGMGRTVLSNLFTEFKCDSLRLAVIKNEKLSMEFGGGMFGCICKFTYGQSR